MKKIAYQQVIFLLVTCFYLVGCGEEPAATDVNQSNNTTQDNKSTLTPEEMAAEKKPLRLTVPSLLGWGDISVIRLSLGDGVEFLVTLEEAETGEPLAGEEVIISSVTGNEFSETKLITDQDGQASVVLLGEVVGQDTVNVTHTRTNLQDSLALVVNELGTQPVSVLTGQEIPELKEKEGVTPWRVLGEVKIRNNEIIFSDEIKKLSGQYTKLEGFMMPLESKEKQQHFLLSLSPPSCFYCMPTGAEGVVEIFSTEEIKYTFDPILLKGQFELLLNDEMGLFYRMKKATLVD